MCVRAPPCDIFTDILRTSERNVGESSLWWAEEVKLRSGVVPLWGTVQLHLEYAPPHSRSTYIWEPECQTMRAQLTANYAQSARRVWCRCCGRTHCTESSICGNSCRHTAPPLRGKLSRGTLHTCCLLPSSAWCEFLNERHRSDESGSDTHLLQWAQRFASRLKARLWYLMTGP